jgi:hypothetical protein
MRQQNEGGVGMSDEQTGRTRGFSGAQVVLFVLIAMIAAAALTFWLARSYLYTTEFKPVSLNQKEQVALDGKLRGLGLDPRDVMPDAKRDSEDRFDEEGRLIAERYSEEGASRNVSLNERELNAMVASSPELARRLAIDLSSNLASAKLLLPMDPDFPVLGGRTLRVTAGLELDYRNERPVVILRGMSVMGVPVPNAWLGNLKNVDLVEQFGGDPGFWRSFAAGIESISVEDGKLDITLKE